MGYRFIQYSINLQKTDIFNGIDPKAFYSKLGITAA